MYGTVLYGDCIPNKAKYHLETVLSKNYAIFIISYWKDNSIVPKNIIVLIMVILIIIIIIIIRRRRRRRRRICSGTFTECLFIH